jgi:hypothetical protein
MEKKLDDSAAQFLPLLRGAVVQTRPIAHVASTYIIFGPDNAYLMDQFCRRTNAAMSMGQAPRVQI